MIPKAIIFDADGMVINMATMYSQRLINENPELKSSIQSFFQNEFQTCVVGRSDLKTKLKPFLSQWGINQTPEAFLHTWFVSEDKPNQELIKLIRKVKEQHISCYLATNQEKYRLAYLADDMGFLHLFDHLFVSCEIGAKKPETKFLNYVWESLQYLDSLTTKAEVMFWDDRPEYISSANAFGFDARQFVSNAMFLNQLQESGVNI